MLPPMHLRSQKTGAESGTTPPRGAPSFVHGVGSDPPKNRAMLSGRGSGIPFFCHKAVSSLYFRPAEGKGLVIFSSKEPGKCPVIFSFNEHGKMPEGRECDGVCLCFW